MKLNVRRFALGYLLCLMAPGFVGTAMARCYWQWQGVHSHWICEDDDVSVITDPQLPDRGVGISQERNRDIGGNAYQNLALETEAIASDCLMHCVNDSRCQAFTFVRGGVQGNAPRCYLKSTVGQKTTNSCCTSGSKYSVNYN